MLLSAAQFPRRKGTSVRLVLNSGDSDRLQPSDGMSWLFGHLWSGLSMAYDQPAWTDDAAPCPGGESVQRVFTSPLTHLSSFP